MLTVDGSRRATALTAAVWVLVALSACAKTGEDLAGIPAEVGWTELVVEVRTEDGALVGGALVRADLHYHPVIPPHPLGLQSTNSSGRVRFRDGLSDWGWVPATIAVEPPAGSNLVGVVRADSAHFGFLPAKPHLVQIILPTAED